jgi:hypothetical protein
MDRRSFRAPGRSPGTCPCCAPLHAHRAGGAEHASAASLPDAVRAQRRKCLRPASLTAVHRTPHSRRRRLEPESERRSAQSVKALARLVCQPLTRSTTAHLTRASSAATDPPHRPTVDTRHSVPSPTSTPTVGPTASPPPPSPDARPSLLRDSPPMGHPQSHPRPRLELPGFKHGRRPRSIHASVPTLPVHARSGTPPPR